MDAPNKITVTTALGDIIAEASADPEYPGIWLSFRPKDREYDINLALADVLPDEDGNPGELLRILVWGDKNREDYTDIFTIANRGDEFPE